VFTKSGAMLAEALHSFSDCGNQLLLLVGVRQARKPPTRSIRSATAARVYFWSFMVALLLSAEAASSPSTRHPQDHDARAVEHVWIGVGIPRRVARRSQGASCLSNIRELDKRRGEKAFMKYLRDTTDSDLVVIFAEETRRRCSASRSRSPRLALTATTGDGRWDGAAASRSGSSRRRRRLSSRPK